MNADLYLELTFAQQANSQAVRDQDPPTSLTSQGWASDLGKYDALADRAKNRSNDR